jgi:hypothetical protein
MDRLKKNPLNAAEATDVALKMLGFIASDSTQLERFCGLSGLGENDIRANIGEASFLAFVYDYVLQDESLVVSFAASEGLKPELFMALRRQLPGAEM